MFEIVGTGKMAKMLGISRETLRQWKLKGMPYKIIENKSCFDIEEVIDWLEMNII